LKLLLILVVYLGTWQGFGPIGQPRDPPFPIWWLRETNCTLSPAA